MSIASLTVDLTASTARFEADIGRATQIATRESERLERAKQTLLKQLDRETESVGRSRGEVLALKLAYAGLGAEAEKYLAAVARSGKAVATTSLDGQSEAVAALAAREEAANARRSASQLELVRSIASVSAAYQEQQRALAQAVAGGTLTPEAYREQLAAAAAVRDAGIKTARQRAAEAEAALEVAAEEERAAERRRAAAQRIVDGQNGLTATYRQQLQALRDLRDAGAISPQQFRQAGADLVAQQPAVQQRRRAAQEAEAEASARVTAAQRATAAEQAATAAFVAGVQRQAEAIGKSRSELLALEAARRGVTTELAPFIARIAASEQSLNKFGRTSGVAKYQLLTLQYTISDVAASLASGISPFTILLQQGGQVADVFANNGGFSALFRTIASVFTVTRVAVGGLVGAFGALAYAAYQGAEQSKAFADAVTLTGNFAGLTEGRFNSLTRTVAASGQVLVSAAREYGLALASTGQISAQNFAVATEAAARFGAATGQSAKDVAQQFAALGDDVLAGATKLNQTYNFLSAAQLRQIRELQEQGRSADAAGIVYEALNTRLKALEPNLGTLDRTLRTVKGAWADFWDAAYDVGRAETIEQKIEKARQALLRAQNVGTERVSQTQLDPERRASIAANRPGDIENASRNLLRLQRQKDDQDAAAAAAAEAAADQKRAASADTFVQGYLKKAKSVESLNKALDEAKRKFADLDKVGQPVPASQQKEILDKIREEFTDKGKQGEANKLAKAERDAAVKNITESLKTERDAYSFQNQYLQGIYQQGLVSLKTYFAAKRDATERDTQAQLNAIDAQIGVQQRFLLAAKGKDPAAAVEAQKNIDSLNEQAKQIVAERQRAVVLANIEEAASYKQLGDRVVEYRAQLLQLQGDEYGAAQLRAAQAIEAARILSRQSAGRPGAISEEEIRQQERALDIANQFAEAQRRVSLVSSDAARLEELAALRAQQRGDSLLETEGQVLAIRQEALEQLARLVAGTGELAAASDDPRIRQAAADLALQYAKAADLVNPTINRLRAGADALGDSLGDAFGRAVKEATKLRDLAKQVIDQVKGSVVDFLITDPLKQSFKGLLRGGINGGLLQPFGGTSTDPTSRNFENSFDLASTAAETLKTSTLSSQAATSLQTNAVNVSTSAITAMASAANLAATALAAVASSSAGSSGIGLLGLGGQIGGGGGFGTGANFGNQDYGLFLADGTNYVPYDGLRATLHKGEAVVPSKYNPAAGGRDAGRVSVTVENHSGGQSRVEESTGADGSRQMRVIIEAAAAEVDRRIAKGGSTHAVLRQTFGVSPVLARRG